MGTRARSSMARLVLLAIGTAPPRASAQVTYVDDPLTTSPTVGAAAG